MNAMNLTDKDIKAAIGFGMVVTLAGKYSFGANWKLAALTGAVFALSSIGFSIYVNNRLQGNGQAATTGTT